jgi:acyl-coenzyme A synthetase/AMP-(fatty) acid ligase
MGVRGLIEASLPRHQWPRGIIVVDDLPRTDTGKLQRFRLRDLILQDRVLQNHVRRGENDS